MAQASTDKLMKVGAATITTLASPGKALGAASINVGSTTNWPTDTGKIVSIWQEELVEGTYRLVAGTYTEWAATHSGTTVNDLTLIYGTDQVYPAGSTTKVALRLSAEGHNRLIDVVSVGLNQDGTHKTFTESNIVPTAAIQASAVTTAKIADDNVTHAKLATGVPVQVVNTTSSAVATGATAIPYDDTIPQITEGVEFMTCAITPKSATNILVIQVNIHIATAATAAISAALFQDATANGLAVGSTSGASANTMYPIPITHTMVAGTTSAITFRVRAGSSTGSTLTFNGASGSRLFGATTKSSIVITEYKA